MAMYKVTIIETLSRVVEVEASDEHYAERIVKDRYCDEEIVLDYGDFDEVDFIVYKD